MVDEIAYQLPPPEMEEETDDGVRRPAAIAADAIICSVGGGGLMNGIIKGIERQSRMRARQGVNGGRGSDVHVVAVETRGASALAESMKANRLISLPGITSMATSLGAIRVAHRTLENAIHPPQGVRVHSLVLDDSAAARGCLRLADDQNLLVELACGVSVEAAVWRSRNSGAACANGCNGVRMDGDAEESSFGSYLSRIIPDFGPKSRVVIIVCGGSNVSVEVAAAWRKSLDDGWGADN
jgi:L-serine/L-threonine ammonia-lyase